MTIGFRWLSLLLLAVLLAGGVLTLPVFSCLPRHRKTALRGCTAGGERRVASSKGLLGLLLGVNLLLTAGFAIVGVHPEWWSEGGAVAPLRGSIFAFFGQVQLYGAMAALAVFLHRQWSWEWLPAFALVFLVSFLSEYCGSTLGIPFGEYGYSDLLGYRIAGQVPIVVPMSWFAMGLASFALAGWLLPGSSPWARHVLTACFLVCWDLVLDPAMSFVTHYWWWKGPGVYYGIPLVNYAGWFLTGLVISLAFEATLPRRFTAAQSRWLAGYYGANWLIPFGMMMAGGLWLGSAVAIGSLVALYSFSQLVSASPRRGPDRRWQVVGVSQ